MNFARKSSFLALVLAVSFALASLLGAHLSMASDMHGMMPNCPLGEVGLVCPMSVSAHISGWQQLFLAVFEKSGIAILLAAIALFIGFALIKYFRTLAWDQSREHRFYKISDNYLFKVIGSGIVHKRE